MILDAKLNDAAHKMLWSEAVHTCERVQNSVATNNSQESRLVFYGENSNKISSFSDFGCSVCVTNRVKSKGQIKDKTFKAIMVRYVENHTHDTYKIYNPHKNRVIIILDIKWADWKETNTKEAKNILFTMDKQDILPSI